MRAPSLAAARAAKALAASHRETAASKERRIEELEERARLFGDSVYEWWERCGLTGVRVKKLAYVTHNP